ncbi:MULTISPECIES: GlxA family transcriptional regulator [unclassified Pseudomonas]|jgi:Transcriptional regulator containing an amidase domain and an AraC-type DNA-binding HTH domain|uniref:GlxA family transcriptional regulator n=1 Tax=unclassified Pseudomonas TaxID=196821 RepID=UPI000487B1C3|nr:MULTISPECIES: GlxA family transcriptional regulator [unclassified Pseudomonas]SME96828.1 transcriptional regulator, AraC family with amidase-like domain [Pseudomonas sp. LAMO17WK12:I1]
MKDLEGVAPQTVGFLLLDNFTLISMASALAPLRIANQLSGKKLYRWLTLSRDGVSVSASGGLQVAPDTRMGDASDLSIVIVCGGVDIKNHVSKEHVRWLQYQAQQGCTLGAVCNGTWALAKAGLLNGHKCSVHWERLEAMRKEFPESAITARLFSVDEKHSTSSGGLAPLDMMLHMIRIKHGRDLAVAISEELVHERMRSGHEYYRVPLKHTAGANQPKLQAAIILMEQNLSVPLELSELPLRLGISRRQLERLFNKYLDCPPSRYYLRLRLLRAHQLLKTTLMPMIEIGYLCGFVSISQFAQSYLGCFGVTLHDERASASTIAQERALNAGKYKSGLALSIARNEITFASMKV